ncbi:MAG: CRISPR-associated protein Cas4, partial [Acetobacteraceae bacterium]|nr:CRISPR-associated protein Cas4 [Acetobacteraceae bacterium]
GVSGRADVVEFVGRPPRPYPIEYKRGRPKPHRADEVQLCAQAICLEEMLGVGVPEGALFYGQTRRRAAVPFDPALRALTAETAAAARSNILAGRTPSPVPIPGCRSCSLQTVCQPDRMSAPPRVADWLRVQIDAAPRDAG